MIIFLLFIILLLLGLPIVYALLVPAIAAFFFYPELPLQLMSARLANSFLSSTLVALPAFIFCAQILSDIKLADMIFDFVNKCVGHVRGGLAHVNVIASVIFAGMSGLAVADAASLGKVEIKAMVDQSYPKPFAAAVTSASATIGPIIPPSIPIIIYGSLAEVSIGKLLIGGLIPGVIMAIVQMIQISLIAKRRSFPKTQFAGFSTIRKSVPRVLPGLMAPFILIGGMLCGFFSPTEVATVTAVYVIIIGFGMKSLNLKGLWQSFKKAALDTAIMQIIFIGGSLISLLVIRLHMADALIQFISTITTSPRVVLLIINIVLLIMGCLLDPIPNLILLTPILLPLIKAFGINEVHFGVVMVLNLMIGLLTPPMGGLLFIICRVGELKLLDLLKEVWPFLVGLLIALMIVTYVPQTVLWLPSLFIK